MVSFFRDAQGNEVDLVLRVGGRLVPVEIKSGATFSPDLCRGLERFAALGVQNTAPGHLLYGGDRSFSVRGVTVHNPLHAENLWSSLLEDKRA